MRSSKEMPNPSIHMPYCYVSGDDLDSHMDRNGNRPARFPAFEQLPIAAHRIQARSLQLF